jgi:tetratricopeptide (TPR) repeat protein
MRSIGPILAALMLALLPVTPSMAEATIWSTREAQQLDALFARLKSAPDEASARALADKIWTIWTRPEDTRIAARVAEIIEKSGFAGPFSQMPLIEKLVADYPDYAEGWNLRATARYFGGDNEGSLSDIDEVLKREPRHFGALAGRAVMLQGQGKGEEALQAIRAALAVHPFLPERQLFPELASQNP